MANIADINAVAQRELSEIKSYWANRTTTDLPTDQELLELLTTYSASALNECLMEVLRLIEKREPVSTSELMHYVTCYATVYFTLGGC